MLLLEQFHYTCRRCGQTSFNIHVDVAVRSVSIYTWTWPLDQFHQTRQCGRQTSFIIHVNVAVRPVSLYTSMWPSDQFHYTCGCRCNTKFITNSQEREKLSKRYTPRKNYELTALYNITIQTTERNNSNNQYNEQALCVHPTTLRQGFFKHIRPSFIV